LQDQINFKNQITCFTDGACSGNPGQGGWGSVVISPQGHVVELGGYEPLTTNNRMELLATIESLELVLKNNHFIQGPSDDPDSEDLILSVYTDSTYVIRGITQWIFGWRKRGWKNQEGGEVSHQELWKQLSRCCEQLKDKGIKIDWKYVRGHSGIPGNERVDEIAQSFSKKKWVQLYQGSLLQYSIPIFDLPETFDLPEMKSPQKTEKKQAYSYLSLVGGQFKRHLDWKSCESEVKGRPGAKFKKAMSPQEEEEIKRSWGLS
jgi:ribonuclease HI